MTSYPLFAQIRAERAAREQRGMVLPFSPTAHHEITIENVRAATWQEIWSEWIDLWGDACLETLHAARQTQLVYEAILEQIVSMERQAEAEETGRLIREVVFES
jgi:hypothetical protein